MKHIFEMEVNRKFDFRWDWKFCWDLSNVISGENWLFIEKWDCDFFRTDFVLLCELWIKCRSIWRSCRWLKWRLDCVRIITWDQCGVLDEENRDVCEVMSWFCSADDIWPEVVLRDEEDTENKGGHIDNVSTCRWRNRDKILTSRFEGL